MLQIPNDKYEFVCEYIIVKAEKLSCSTISTLVAHLGSLASLYNCIYIYICIVCEVIPQRLHNRKLFSLHCTPVFY